MKAKKSLGQHFLRSGKALSQIVDAAGIQPGNTVLEIGPGEGVLTERLLSRGARVIAIEKDHELIPTLQQKFSSEIAAGKLTLIEADILDFNLTTSTFHLPYKLVANIPYYITGAIIEKFLSTQYQPEKMVLLIQKEVAERIIARDKKMSIPAIAVSAYGEAKLIAKVPPGAFAPAPTVDSAILLIDNISREFFTPLANSGQAACDEALFFKLLKTIFGKKRKQLGGMLTEIVGDKEKALQILTEADLDTKIRPENMTLAQWKTLTTIVTEKIGV